MKPSLFLNPLPCSAPRLQHALLLSGVLSLAACANFSGISPHAQALTAEQLNLQGTATTEISVQWWESFGDAQLNRLVADALANSPSLRVAQTRLERVQATQDRDRKSVV